MTLWQRIKFVFGMYEAPKKRWIYKPYRDENGMYSKRLPALHKAKKVSRKTVLMNAGLR